MNDTSNEQDPHDDAPPIAGLDRLPMSREPGHDLWSGIQSRIAPPPLRQAAPRRRWVPLAAAAALTAAIAGLISLRQPGPTPAQTVAAAPASEPAQRAAAAAAPSLHGPSRALVKANLKIVKTAEDQLRQALATDPNDQYLKSLLASAQTQKEHLRGLLDRNLI